MTRIGQKMAERVESFHFTHAINSFRRQVNVELACDEVKPHLRPGLGGMMVLPVSALVLIYILRSHIGEDQLAFDGRAR
jgi:hypothetical protein